MEAGLILLIVIAVFALLVAAKTVRIIPQARAGVVERLGRYQRTLSPGLAIIVPFVDRVSPMIDLREQVVTFNPAGVITGDNVGIQIDSVLYFTITDAKSVSYEVANPLQAIEQLTVTTLRNVIGGMTLEEALTSRDTINSQLRTGTAALVGKTALVTERIDADGGAVKLEGELWTARPYVPDEVIESGSRVHVVEIQGATALVSEA